jgi:methyl-accepting chemotaxis protein
VNFRVHISKGGKMNIKYKLTLAFAAIASLPAIAVAVLVILQVREDARSAFLDSSGREIRQVDNAMQLFFEGIRQNVEFLAAHPLLQNIDGNLKRYLNGELTRQPEGPQEQALFQLFAGMAKSHPAYAYVSVGTSEGGYLFWPGDPKLSDYDPRSRPWYQRAMANPGQTLRTEAYYWPGDDVVLVSSVRSFANRLGAQGGVVNIDVSLKQLTDMVRQIKLGESGYLMLMERNGTVLVDPNDPQHNFKALAALGDGYAALANAGSGLQRVTLGGERYMANVYASKALGWQFIGLIRESEVMAGATRLTWLIALVAAVAALLFALAGA